MEDKYNVFKQNPKIIKVINMRTYESDRAMREMIQLILERE